MLYLVLSFIIFFYNAKVVTKHKIYVRDFIFTYFFCNSSILSKTLSCINFGERTISSLPKLVSSRISS